MAVTLLGVEGSKEKKITVIVRSHQGFILGVIWNQM